MHDVLKGLAPQSVVLDLGCGNGSFHYETCSSIVVALDVSFVDKVLRKDEPRFSYLCGDSGAIPLAAHSVDFVVCHHTLEHFAQYRIALSEIARVLKPEGWLWVAVPNGYGLDDNLYRFLFSGGGHVNRFTREGLIEDIRQITQMELIAWCDLFSSFIYLRKPTPVEAKHYPPTARFLGEVPDGFSTVGAIVINAATRIADRLLQSRLSQYGWGFIFRKGAVAETLSLSSYFNVCRKCGSGHPFKYIRNRTLAGIGFYNCPNCGELNMLVAPPKNVE